MSELIGMLGTLSALLTLVGTYRLGEFFFGGGASLSLLFAIAVTVIYLVFFEQIILLLGFATLATPIAGLAYWYYNSQHGTTTTGSSKNGPSTKGNSQNGKTTQNQCGNCGTQNDSDEMFCHDCGYRLS